VILAAVSNIGIKDQTVNAKWKPFKKARKLIKHGGTKSEIPPGVGLRIGQHTMDEFI
jgi:hypothetical protein